jgi:LuxR family maltose regulon positive regulatory protein
LASESRAEAQFPRPHIIQRPRLTRLLDASDARVVMLVAPAGYGKTTLAGQWLETKHHALYRATPAARDVAALIAGLADAAASVARADPSRVLQRLAHAPDPERELSEFLPLMATLFESWPSDAWLAIDDYHYVVGSSACEAIIEALWARSGVKMLISTRRRPTWASARRLLYGDLFELGPETLTMSVEEAKSVLHSSRAASRLVDLANGWPAVLGLAAMAEPVFVAEDRLERDLYDYFADELLAATTDERRAQFAALAVPPSISKEIAHELFGGDAADAALRDAVRLGFAAPSHRARGNFTHS